VDRAELFLRRALERRSIIRRITALLPCGSFQIRERAWSDSRYLADSRS
jgi:hypothetical protein